MPAKHDYEGLRLRAVKETAEKIKKELARGDNALIQVVRTVDTLDKTTNLLTEQLDYLIKTNTSKEITDFEASVKRLKESRGALVDYLKELMLKEAPNISAVAGYYLGAKLISTAGSLKRLSEFPSSTIQVMGAEKALFAHLRKGTAPPKYGIIFQHEKVRTAPKEKSGRIARRLASKISLAARVDYFKGEFIGDKLAKEFEEEVERIRASA